MLVSNQNEVINLCPKGTRPHFTDRRTAGVMRQTIIQCNCGCLVIKEGYSDSLPGQRRARATVIDRWNKTPETIEASR